MKVFLILGLIVATRLVSVAQEISMTDAQSALNAVVADNPAPIRILLGNGFPIDFRFGNAFGRDWQARTLLGIAAAEAKNKVVRLLVSQGANLEVSDGENGYTPLLLAIRAHNGEGVRILLDGGANVNAQSGFGSSALHVAARHNAAEMLDWLLAKRPNLTLRNKNGSSAAEVAALWMDQAGVSKLVAAGVPFEMDLVYAAGLGDIRALKASLQQGADPNKANKDRASPLEAAAMRGQAEAAQLLLSAGAKPDLGSAVLLAIDYGHNEVAARLLAAGADPNRVSETDGMYPLAVAVQNGNEAAVKLLLGNRASVKGMGEKFSPIHEAVRSDNAPILKLLIEGGADINATVNGGWTPLMIAANENKPRAAQFLLQNGAKLALKVRAKVGDGAGMETREVTALQLAQIKEHATIVQLFRDPDSSPTQSGPRSFLDSRKVKVGEWRQKYEEFDPRRGIIAGLESFKQTFGEPARIVEIEATALWYYQCADGWIELTVADPRLTGAQLLIKGIATVAEPSGHNSGPREISRPASNPASTTKFEGENAASKKPAESQTTTATAPAVSASSKVTMAEWREKAKTINKLPGAGTVSASKEQLYRLVGEPQGSETNRIQTILYWDCSDGRIQVAAASAAFSLKGEVFGPIKEIRK